MKKLLFITGTILLFTALALNVRINLNQAELPGVSLFNLQNIAMAFPEEPEEGAISRIIDCDPEMQWLCMNPSDPNDCRWYEVPFHREDCLLNWPNTGCFEHDCEENEWGGD